MDMGGTQGKSARCPREEPAHRLFRAEFRSREPRHGNRGKKRRKFMPRWLRGGALLEWGPVRAWIGSRLKPSGKCRIWKVAPHPTAKRQRTSSNSYLGISRSNAARVCAIHRRRSRPKTAPDRRATVPIAPAPETSTRPQHPTDPTGWANISNTKPRRSKTHGGSDRSLMR